MKIEDNKTYKFILNYFRKLAWKDKSFVGGYWDNKARIKEFAMNRNIICLHVESYNDKNFVANSFSDDPLLNKKITELRRLAKLKGDKLLQASVLYYVNDNIYTRNVLGYSETFEHARITGVYPMKETSATRLGKALTK